MGLSRTFVRYCSPPEGSCQEPTPFSESDCQAARHTGRRKPVPKRKIILHPGAPERVQYDGAEDGSGNVRSEEHTSELQSQSNLVCRLLLEKKKKTNTHKMTYTMREM